MDKDTGATGSLPGKTGPRLLADIKTYDPRQRVKYNPFTDPPPGFVPGDNSSDHEASSLHCRHSFAVVPTQSLLKSEDSSSRINRLSAVCQKCIWHLELTIDYNPCLSASRSSCPTIEYPLHHFVITGPPQKLGDSRETYNFKCTACRSRLDYCIRPPRLTPRYYALLTDPKVLRARFQAAEDADGDRPGLEPQTGMKVLEALAAYLRDSLGPDRKNRRIPIHNKRFKLSFGQECDGLLLWLGFKQIDGEEPCWELPDPPLADPLGGETVRVLVEDVLEELYASLRRFSYDEKRTMKHPPPAPLMAEMAVNEMLGAVTYQKSISRLRIDLTRTDDVLYAGLGALSDFSNELLMYAFRRQVNYNPESSAFYYDCIAEIAQIRQNEDFNMEIGMLASEGFVSRSELINAYKYFSIDPNTAHAMSDGQILGMFDSRLENSPRGQELELRERLRMIGQARGSKMLQSAAENEVQTEEQALKWLDPTYDGNVHITDEYIIAMAAARITDRPDQADACKKAVGIIAGARRSETLQTYLATGGVSNDFADDEATAAYRFFDIQDRAADIDFDVMETIMNLKVSDEPHREAEIQRYFNILLQQRAGDAGNASTQQDFNTPVGLSNMGNTCYLNCLLQYFFTIKPLREVILDFDNHKMDTSAESFVPKKVGGRDISRTEVIKAQEFVRELQTLFQDMASAPGPVVNPTWRLAGLALAQSENTQRRSTIGGERPNFKSPIKEHPPTLDEHDDENEMVFTNSEVVKSDNSSDVTLIEPEPKTPESSNHEKDDSNRMVVDSKEDEQNLEQNLQPGRPRADSGLEMEDDVPALVNPSPPSRPPPVPPRPQQPMIGPQNNPFATGNAESSWRQKAEAAANQQDVHEVMENILFKLECAIKPDAVVNETTEQTNAIKELFFGKWTWSYLNKKAEDKSEPFSVIFLALDKKPKDIYAALDTFFDIGEVQMNGEAVQRYPTVTKLPPMLQIYFQRQDFDVQRSESYMINHHVQLEDVIYMDRYISSSKPEVQALRQQSWDLKHKVRKLQDKRSRHDIKGKLGVTGPDTLDATWQFINKHGEDLGSDQDLLDDLKTVADLKRSEMERLNNQIVDLQTNINRLFAQFEDTPYRLAAIFVHRGDTKGGHYWIYIRDYTKNIWRRYEDRDVRELLDQAEVFAEGDPQIQGAPYFVVYVRDGEKDDLVEALWRVAQEKGEEVADILMDDVKEPEEGKVVVEKTEDEDDATKAYHG